MAEKKSTIKPISDEPQKPTRNNAPEGMTLVPNDALSEIRVTLHTSLESAINFAMEAGPCMKAAELAGLIRPAVERLKAICEQNDFPE
ncbi:MAG: hypothetical protein JW793_08985 [Acidobacteria bacterium]|nr:hypothetical protein [Acidobacteriota bacterium]